MTRTAHTIYIGILTVIAVCTFAALVIIGTSYYKVALTERMYHPDHDSLKPSGTIGHGIGILGSLLMITGIASYMARKRFRFLSRIGKLKYWLEFHIFLCTIGPLLILFHTAFKFGGIVAVSFWCMVAVFLSGIVGRFIYLQIPRSIEGRELSLTEIREMKRNIAGEISKRENITEEYKNIVRLVKQDRSLSRKISRLDTMQRLFRYWHVVHLPFALIMLIIMAIHIFITVLFGYRWIF
ncbi:MAG: hypothetical protein MUE74_04115 [Bacteroidales bacterium]|jgi:hypothetical protein|nr:hypothetical protein [Bacteroidales bacterium]